MDITDIINTFKLPYYDTRIKYDINIFNDNKIQKYVALFLLNPSNYEGIDKIPISSKEDYFMSRFNRFYTKYINLSTDKNFDTCIYFNSLNIDKPGSTMVCSSGDFRSNSGRKQLKDEYKNTQELTRKCRDYLSKKYRIVFDPTKPDPRLFIGHNDIWLNPSPLLLEKENWYWVEHKSYNDLTVNTKFPNDLDPDLIPLSIRNKVLQKWKTP